MVDDGRLTYMKRPAELFAWKKENYNVKNVHTYAKAGETKNYEFSMTNNKKK
jgi:hypothetical protein